MSEPTTTAAPAELPVADQQPVAAPEISAPVVPAETTVRKLIVVLGASYGGVSITHYLLKHVIPSLSRPSDYQVVLVSPSNEIVARPAMPRALLSDTALDQKKLFVSIPSVLEQYPAESWRFIHGAATAMDHASKKVMVRPHGEMAVSEELSYYALVVATGATTRSPLHGLTTDSDALRASWAALREAMPNAKSIVIAGGGPAGIETAGELGQHLNGRAGKFSKKLANPKVAITVVTSGDQILPVLRPAIAAEAEKLLAKVGVTVRKNTRVNSVEPATSGTVEGPVAAKTVVTLEDGTTLDADIYIPATGFTFNTRFVHPDLLQEDGRVKVNPGTLRVDAAGENALLYVVGDASSAHRPAVHNLMDTVPVLGNNIKRDLLQAEGATDLPAEKTYVENTKEMQLVPIGTATGVGAAMGLKLPGFMVKMIKGRDYFLWTTPRLWNGQQWAKA